LIFTRSRRRRRNLILGLLDADPDAAVAAFAADRARLRNPAMDTCAYIAGIERAGLMAAVAALRAFDDRL
jgi:hypothetical protein